MKIISVWETESGWVTTQISSYSKFLDAIHSVTILPTAVPYRKSFQQQVDDNQSLPLSKKEPD